MLLLLRPFTPRSFQQLATVSPVRQATFTTSLFRMAQEFKLKGLSSLDLKGEEKKEFEVEGIDGAKILLIQHKGEIHAMTSKCSHYGWCHCVRCRGTNFSSVYRSSSSKGCCIQRRNDYLPMARRWSFSHTRYDDAVLTSSYQHVSTLQLATLRTPLRSTPWPNSECLRKTVQFTSKVTKPQSRQASAR